jgi:aspartate/methionine/tyrosine aminotransferase
MPFSTRTAVPRETNALAGALAARRDAGLPVLDLTESNPTTAGLPYDEARILAALSRPEALTYSPSAFGLREAREAVATTYRHAGVPLDPARVVLTASTSEAYALLFKLLSDDGDDVLVPQPSYPLFDLLARFEGVRIAPYPLAYDGEWHVDRAALERAVTPRTRAILVVNPNNPTGSYVKRDELAALAALGLPIVSDEVFAPFPLRDDPRRVVSALESPTAELVFALSGLSKLAGLPQMKLGWIAVGGSDRAAVTEALARLELLADASLSVGTPVQVALPDLLAGSAVTRDAIRARLRTNLDVLRGAVASTSVTLLDVEGGWYATLRLPRVAGEEAWALSFLEDGVYVHPGHFFDFPAEAFVVVSLLTPEGRFAEGVARVVRGVERRVAGEVSSP